MTEHIRLFGSLCLILAGLLALPGWLLPLRDGAARFTWRYLACGTFMVTFFAWAYGHGASGGWGWVLCLIDAALGFWMYDRASHWWRETEKARNFGRRWSA